MAEQKVEVILDGRDAGAVRAWLAARDSVEAYEKSLAEISTTEKKNTQGAAEYERMASRVFESTRTPLERYNKELDKLGDLFQSGLIDAQTYNRAVAEQKRVFEATDDSIRSVREEQERLRLEQERLQQTARRVVESVLTPQQRYNRTVRELDGLLQKTAITQETYNRAVAKAKKEHDSFASGGTKGLAELGAQLSALAGGYAIVTGGANLWLSANQKALEQAEEVANKYDTLFRKFQVQAGLTDLQGKDAQKNILDVAERRGVDEDFAQKGATQLVSSGFSSKEGQGEALDVALQTFAAGNLLDQDPTQLTQALGQFLAAQGLDKNAANLRRVGVGTQRLFKGTDLQISDLTQLAGKSQSFAGKITPEEVLGTFDVLREKTGADNASTALKIFGDRLMGAKGDSQREDVLKRLNLKPEDVDFLGENMESVLGRLSSGLDSVKPEERQGLIQKLFGTEAASPITGLLRDRDKLPGAIATISDQSGFAEDVQTATSGRAAGRRRLELQQRRRQAEEDQMGDLRKLALDNTLRDNGALPIERDIRAGIFDKVSYATGSRDLGQRAATTSKSSAVTGALGLTSVSGAISFAAQAATGGFGGGDNAAVNERLAAALQENTAALKENSKATDQNTGGERVPSMPNVTPPPPVPAARLGGN